MVAKAVEEVGAEWDLAVKPASAVIRPLSLWERVCG